MRAEGKFCRTWWMAGRVKTTSPMDFHLMKRMFGWSCMRAAMSGTVPRLRSFVNCRLIRFDVWMAEFKLGAVVEAMHESDHQAHMLVFRNKGWWLMRIRLPRGGRMITSWENLRSLQ